MRLINADMLMKEYQVKLCCNTDCINCTLFQGDGEECLFDRFVKNAPTIDAEPVVRCKECCHYKHYKCFAGECFECDVFEYSTKETDFCSRAERIADGTD